MSGRWAKGVGVLSLLDEESAYGFLSGRVRAANQGVTMVFARVKQAATTFTHHCCKEMSTPQGVSLPCCFRAVW
eukprot:928219-Pelagomonas_calceolata.AAC.1